MKVYLIHFIFIYFLNKKPTPVLLLVFYMRSGGKRPRKLSGCDHLFFSHSCVYIENRLVREGKEIFIFVYWRINIIKKKKNSPVLYCNWRGYAHGCLILLEPSCFLFPSLVVRCYLNCMHHKHLWFYVVVLLFYFIWFFNLTGFKFF